MGNNTKAMRIKMAHTDGEQVHWTVCSYSGINLVLGQKARKIRGWSFTDHEGYDRVVEGNWFDLVAHFRLVAANYGFTSTIS